jgi:hypothetical protein
MNCREFENKWNDLLDSHLTGSSQFEQAMEAHASTCERCRSVSSRYQVLRQAISAWSAPPAPSAESIERLYELTVPSTPLRIPARRSRLVRWLPMSAAAALFALAWVGWSAWRARPLPEDFAPALNSAPSVATNPVPIGRPLAAALADATVATIGLALEASAPATRIGREILDLDNLMESVTIKEAANTADDSSGSDLLQDVGQRVNESVKPISGSARHAFSFLLGPPPGPDPAPAESQGSL